MPIRRAVVVYMWYCCVSCWGLTHIPIPSNVNTYERMTFASYDLCRPLIFPSPLPSRFPSSLPLVTSLSDDHVRVCAACRPGCHPCFTLTFTFTVCCLFCWITAQSFESELSSAALIGSFSFSSTLSLQHSSLQLLLVSRTPSHTSQSLATRKVQLANSPASSEKHT